MTSQTIPTIKQGLYKLPEGWKWVRIKEICEKPQYGFTAPAIEDPIGPKMIRITDIQEGQVDWNKVPYCKIAEQEHKKFKLELGDILFARTGATTGKSFLVKEYPDSIFASYLIRLRTLREMVIPEYLSLFFQSAQYWKQIRPRGGAQPNMNARLLSNLFVPLPPLEEQRRIVGRLEQLLSKIEEARKLRKQATEETEQIMRAALHKVFSKAEEKGWEWVKLGNILTRRPQYGLTAKSSKEEKEIRYIRISDITDDGTLKSDDPRFLDLDTSQFEKYKLEENDILIARSGTVGRVYLHKPLKQKAVFASYLIRFKLDPTRTIPKFFFYYALSPFYKKWVQDTLRIVAQPNINAERYSKLKIPFPPLEEQRKIVAYLDGIKETTEFLKQLQQETEEELEKLVPAILDRAFRGEL